MSYRLLLPCSTLVPVAGLESAMDGLETECIGRTVPRWHVGAMASEQVASPESPLLVTLYQSAEVARQPYDVHFHAPPGVCAWVEVRVSGDSRDPSSRLRARLVALTIAERLGAAVLETRSGVYCRTPEAFAAWCSRKSHPETMVLAAHEHVTDQPASGPGLRRPPASAPLPPPGRAPLPNRTWCARAWHWVNHLRPYTIPVPPSATREMVAALITEVERTFHKHNVFYDPDNHRLVIFGKNSRAARESVSFFTRRARTTSRGGHTTGIRGPRR